MSSESPGKTNDETGQERSVDFDLLELEKYIHDIWEFLPIPICQISPRGVILDSDTAFEKLLGYSKEELIGSLLSGYFSDRHEFDQMQEDTLSKGSVSSFRTILKTKGQECIVATVSTLSRKDENGQHVGYFASFIDITDREQSEVELRESQEKYSMLFHSSNDGIFLHDLEGRIIDVNQKVIDEFGYSREEFLGLNIREIHPQGAQLDSRKAFEEITKKGAVHFDIDFLRKDGSVFPAEVSSSIIEPRGKKVVQGIVRNATERKRAMEALRESEEKYRDVIEHSLQGIIIVQGDPIRIKFANTALARIFGYSVDELAGFSQEDISGLIHPDDRIMALSRLQSILSGGAPSPRNEIRIRKKDGSVSWIEIYGNTVQYEGKPALQVSVVDITDRKRIEAELKENEGKYRNLVEQSMLGIVIAQIDPFKIHFSNAAAANTFGYTPSELTAMDPDGIKKRVHPDDLPVIFKRFAALMKGAKPEKQEIRIIKRDGSERRVEIFGHRIEHEGAAVLQVTILDITERRKAERARIESELRYKVLFENSPLSITIVNTAGVVLDCNKRTEQIIGFTREEIVGKRFDKLVTLKPESLPTLQKKFESLVSGNEVKPYELEIVTKDGQDRILRVTNAIVTQKETIVGFQIIAADITAQKMTEHELRKSEQEYLRLSQEFKGILDAIPDNLTFQDTDMRIVWANQGAADSINKGIDEVIGKRCFTLWHGKDDPCEGCPVLIAMATKKPAKGEIDTPDGRHWEVRGFPILEDGSVRGVVEIARDISDPKRMEDALRESEEKYRLLLEQSGDIITYFSAEGVCLAMNRNAAAGLEGSPESLVGKNLRDLFDEEIAKWALERIRRVLVKGESEEHEDIVRLPGGRGWYRSSYHIVRGAKGDPIGVQIISRDITERKRMEEELQRSERMKLLAQLAMGVSHEVRNPLGAILASTEALYHDLEDHSEYSEYLSHIRTQVNRLSILMKDLLELGKPIGESTFENESLQMLCSSGVELWKQSTSFISCKLTFERPAGYKNIIVHVDGARIQQVCINLLENAAQNSPEGSEILLKVFEPEDGFVRIHVTDEGYGIREEDLDRVFEPFFSTRKQGSGLGLSIVKQVVETHGGTVTIRNNEGKPGCTAEVTLPVVS